MNVRKLALSFLNEYENQGKYVNLSLSSHSADSLTAEERGFLTALLYTAVENKLTYDYYIASLSGRSIEKIDTHTKNILRLGICQILKMEKIPAFAAVNESVKLARNKGERSFVNGVLRAVEREKNSLPLPDRKKNLARHLSVLYSFPTWIVKHFIKEIGETETEKLLGYISKIPPTDLTVNTVKTSRQDFADSLSREGIDVSLSEYSPISLRIDGSVDPRKLPGYSEGKFFVQDASCAAAVNALGIENGEFIIDVCACPGGKSFAAAILGKDEVRVNSFDIHESKLSLIEDGAERLGLSSVNFAVRDATCPDESMFGKADKVICDVPCSGLGVLSKKPDLRYRDGEGIKELPDLQYSILNASKNYLKYGGRMIYSTCTLNSEENCAVVDRFLSENLDFHTVDFTVGDLKSENGRFTFIPHVHKTDGFFVCLLEKDSI